jgi:MFS family permease
VASRYSVGVTAGESTKDIRRSPLRAAAFRRQYFSRLISQTGGAVAPVALAFGVLAATGSAAALGIVLAAFSVPQLIFMLVGGVWADRLPRQRIMMSADAVRFVTQTTFGVLLLTGHAPLWAMVGLEIFAGTASAFSFPASLGLTNDTVRPDQMQSANALLALSLDTANTVGPLVAGVAVAFSSAGWVLIFDGLTFAASVAILAGLRLPARAPHERQSFFVELRDGWREVRTRTWVWLSIVYFMVFNLVFAAIDVLGPASVAKRPHGALAWGAIAAAMSAGQLLGNSMALRLRPRRLLATSRWWELLAVPVCVALGLGAPLPVLLIGAGTGRRVVQLPGRPVVHRATAAHSRAGDLAGALVRRDGLLRAAAGELHDGRRRGGRARGRASPGHRRRGHRAVLAGHPAGAEYPDPHPHRRTVH